MDEKSSEILGECIVEIDTVKSQMFNPLIMIERNSGIYKLKLFSDQKLVSESESFNRPIYSIKRIMELDNWL